MFQATSSLSLQWYVLYTLPNYEKRIYKQLVTNSVTCFLPLQNVVRQWGDRKKTLQVPLFPNYIFIYTNSKERFSILNMPGASRYVTHCKKAVILSDDAIQQIKRMSFDETVITDSCPEKGDYVKIIDGPFLNMEGIVYERKGQTRFGVKISGLSQFLSVEINSCSLLRLSRAS